MTPQLLLLSVVATFAFGALWSIPSEGATAKFLDTTLLLSNDETYRWSEGSTINLDGKQHLMMAVTLFGPGGHDNTEAQIIAFRSQDGGLTWTPLQQAEVLQENVGEENTMAPSLLRLDNGELLFFANVKNSIHDCGPWMKRSTDNGKTWGDLQRLPYSGYGGLANDRAIQIGTGRIVLPCWVSTDALASTHAYCLWSDDRGETWHKTDLISTPAGSTGRRTDPAAEEPMIIELKDGRLMMIMRTYLKSIYKCYSVDGGETWAEPVSSGIPSPGSMATIKRLPNGDILLVWNWARVPEIDGPWPRNFISTAISQDEGRTFSSVRHLDGAADFDGKITMANVAFAEGDRAIVSYSKSMTKKNEYNWRVQVLPLEWFYEGDRDLVYGETYLPTLEAELERLRRPQAALPDSIPRPSVEQREQMLARIDLPGVDGDGLVAAYSFEEGEGDFVYDASEGRNDLWVRRVESATQWCEGKEGGGIEFGGRDASLMAPHSDTLEFPGGRFTVEAWVYPTRRKAHGLIATKEHMWEVGLLDGKLKAAVRSGGGWGSPGWLGGPQVPLGRWTHVAVTFDGKALRFYVDGNLAATASRPCKMDLSNEPLAIGGCTHIEDASFAGRLDEVRIWRVVRYDPPQESTMQDAAGGPRVVSSTHQLFIEDDLIASVEGLERVVNQPVRHHNNPVLTYERPWEGNCVITWGSVMYDEDERLFRIWYEAYDKYGAPGEQTLVCYATSPDGVSWTKPDLGLVDYRGSKANNIVLRADEGTLDAPTVVRVPDVPAEQRWRMYWHSGAHGGIRCATSTDGLRWRVRPGVVVEAGDRNTVSYDASSGMFRLITRIPGRGMRTCGLWESDDGEEFAYIGEIAAPDDRDPEKTEFYGMIHFSWSGLHLGFLELFHVPIRKLNCQLMYSRDGYDWRRACGRRTFLDWGPPGAWDQAWVTPSHNPPIRVGERLYIFYQGRQTLHWAEEPFGHIGGIGLCFLRPDGFVSLDAQNLEGSVTTTPLLLRGERLHVNALARPGTVIAEVLDAEGEPIGGFSRADCVPLRMVDTLDGEMAWHAKAALRELVGRPVRLRFYVQAAKLYSFWTE